MKTDKTELFEKTPVTRAVAALVVPTVISQIVTVIYNMADTFFIGQVGDPNQVAVASLCLPLFLLTTGLANLFGIGGASLVSRSLGLGDRKRARSTSAFCIWTSAAAALLYGAAVFALRGAVLPAVGADESTYGFCESYLLWTLAVGAVPTVLNAALAHLVRAEGYSGKQASEWLSAACLTSPLTRCSSSASKCKSPARPLPRCFQTLSQRCILSF